jgi:hypothetical protein
MSQFLDHTAPALQGTPPRRPAELPHGLLTPPDWVRQLVEEERAKHPADVFARHEERLLNERTIGYYFDGLCQEVLYRPTPQGPEVLAVGWDEVHAVKTALPPERLQGLKTFLGY